MLHSRAAIRFRQVRIHIKNSILDQSVGSQGYESGFCPALSIIFETPDRPGPPQPSSD